MPLMGEGTCDPKMAFASQRRQRGRMMPETLPQEHHLLKGRQQALLAGPDPDPSDMAGARSNQPAFNDARTVVGRIVSRCVARISIIGIAVAGISAVVAEPVAQTKTGQQPRRAVVTPIAAITSIIPTMTAVVAVAETAAVERRMANSPVESAMGEAAAKSTGMNAAAESSVTAKSAAMPSHPSAVLGESAFR